MTYGPVAGSGFSRPRFAGVPAGTTYAKGSATHLGSAGPLMPGESALRVERAGDRVFRAREGDEERVALRVDLVSGMALERVAEKRLVCREHVGVAVAQLLD